jgi:hypothetical protein
VRKVYRSIVCRCDILWEELFGGSEEALGELLVVVLLEEEAVFAVHATKRSKWTCCPVVVCCSRLWRGFVALVAWCSI